MNEVRRSHSDCVPPPCPVAKCPGRADRPGHSRPVWVAFFLASLLSVPHGAAGAAAEEEGMTGPLLIQGVAVHERQIAFAAAGIIWLVDRGGGTARALTNGKGDDRLPVFSPDGGRIAFSRMKSGSGDVFIYDIASDKARRRTFHPATDWPVAFSPNGEKLLIVSDREIQRMNRLYEIGDSPLPRPLPLPMGAGACYGPNGRRIAYLPFSSEPEFREFRHYRGGLTSRLFLADPETGPALPFSPEGSNARCPIWLGDKIYYLSDESGIFNLYVRPAKGGEARRLTGYTSFGIRAASGWGDTIVYARDGYLYEYRPSSGQSQRLALSVPLDMSRRRERLLNAAGFIESLSFNNRAEKVAVSAHGEVFAVDVHTAKAINLTQTSGGAGREGVFSPE